MSKYLEYRRQELVERDARTTNLLYDTRPRTTYELIVEEDELTALETTVNGVLKVIAKSLTILIVAVAALVYISARWLIGRFIQTLTKS